MNNIVITGGAGFIGSNFIDYLSVFNIDKITVIDNFSTGSIKNINHYDNVEILESDLSNYDYKRNLILEEADYVFHLAALADIVPSINNPCAYFNSNVTGTLNVIEALKHSKKIKKIIYAASSSCYGIPSSYPTNEDAQISPKYPYALTKRLGEELILHWGELYDLPVISTRFFNVYGPKSRTNGSYGAMFGVFLAQKINGMAYTVVGDGNQSRDFTYVSDVCDALYKLALSSIKNDVFNIGTGKNTTINKIVSLLGGEVVHVPKRPGEPDITLADISKVKNTINWEPKINIEDGIKMMLANIDYWKDAPLWNAENINAATVDWFKYLK